MGEKGYITCFLIFLAIIGLSLSLFPMVPPEKATVNDLNLALSILQEARKKNDMEKITLTTRWLKTAVPEVTARFLRRNFCDTSRKDINEAILLLKFTRLFLTPKMEDGITEWLRRGFRAYAYRKVSEGASSDELTELIRKALSIGLGDVAESLLSGKKFSFGCDEIWHGTLVWSQKSTPPVESVDVWNEMKISMGFYLTVSKEGKVKGIGSGKTDTYTLEIVCKDHRKKVVPVEIVDRNFPVIIIGTKDRKSLRIRPVFQARIELSDARMECTDTDIGEVVERVIDLGRLLSNTLYFHENGLLTIPISGEFYSYKSPEAGLYIQLERIK